MRSPKLLLLAMMASMTAGCATTTTNQHVSARVEAPKGYAFGYQALDMEDGSRAAAQVFDDGRRTYFILPRGANAERAYSPEHHGVPLVKEGPYWIAEAVGSAWFVPKVGGHTLCIRKGSVSIDGCESLLGDPVKVTTPDRMVVARAQTDSGQTVVVNRKIEPVAQAAANDENVAVYPAPTVDPRTAHTEADDQPRLQKAAYAPLPPGEGARIAKQSRDEEIDYLRKQLAILEKKLVELSKKLEKLDAI
jgi:hypothetical protein